MNDNHMASQEGYPGIAHDFEKCKRDLTEANETISRLVRAQRIQDSTTAAVLERAEAERERWRAPVTAMHDAVMDTLASGRPVAHLDAAAKKLMEMLEER